MGNHRDAWVFGVVDPNSGTVGLMEIARVAGLLRKNSEWLKGRQNDTNISSVTPSSEELRVPKRILIETPGL